MKRLLAAVAVPAIALSLSLPFSAFEDRAAEPVDRPMLELRTHVAASVADYLRGNGLAETEKRMRSPDTQDQASDYLVALASEADGPGGIVLHYDIPSCGLTLPAGRQFRFNHVGGFIDEIEGIFPLEPLAWNPMQAELKALIELFDTSGWRRSSSRYTPNRPVQTVISPQDFSDKTGPKWADVGFWEQCDNPNIKLYLEIRHYNSSSPGPFTPPAVLSAPLDPLAEDRFLFLASIKADYKSPLRDEMTDLRDRRRLAVNGDRSEALPASVWLDDPNWRPPGWRGQFIR